MEIIKRMKQTEDKLRELKEETKILKGIVKVLEAVK